jgi:prephenate dehydrogenase
MTVQLTIIGLGQIGTSLGLALASQTQQITRIGHDRELSVAKQAEKLGAIDKVVHNLHSAVEGADIVFLAIPVDQIRVTLEQIAPDLKSGAVVLDTSPVQSAITNWAVELLPEDRHYVSFVPTLNPAYLLEIGSGIDLAHTDLFKNGLVFISSPAGTDPDAIRLASDLSALVGAHTMFADPMETDGLSTSTHLVPRLASAAILNALIDQPGWTEGRKLAGRVFALMTEPVLHMDETKVLGKAAILNRDHVVRVINDMMLSLRDLRDAVAEEDEETLEQLLKHAQKGREEWWQQRQTANWDRSKDAPKMPSSGEVMSRFFGFRGKKKEEK